MNDKSKEPTREQRIGERIKAERKKSKNRSMTQLMLADKMHVMQNTISNWETGTVMPSVAQLLQLADIFKCDVAYLLCDYDSRNITDDWISDKTGLSIPAIENLKEAQCKKALFSAEQGVINALLASPDFWDDVLNRLRAAVEIMAYPLDTIDDPIATESNPIENDTTKRRVDRIEDNYGKPARFVVNAQTAAEVQIQFAADRMKEIFMDIVKDGIPAPESKR